jgi:pimeloyl-ACP methyl ester carboxylesterase
MDRCRSQIRRGNQSNGNQGLPRATGRRIRAVTAGVRLKCSNGRNVWVLSQRLLLSPLLDKPVRQNPADTRIKRLKSHYDGIKAFSETDFTEDLKSINLPTLVMHGDDDQIVPIADSAPLSAKLLKKGTLKVYEKYPHGMATVHADVINRDLLAFFKQD